jgi:hypothetical protein
MTAAGKGHGGRQRRGHGRPADAQALEQEIGQTREDLGETVAALAAKTDVKARAADKARGLTSRMTSKASHAGDEAATRAGRARGQLAGQAGRGRTLLGATPPASRQLGKEAAARIAATAAPARQAGQRAVAAARQRPVRAAAVAGTGVLVLAVLVRAWRRRR